MESICFREVTGDIKNSHTSPKSGFSFKSLVIELGRLTGTPVTNVYKSYTEIL